MAQLTAQLKHPPIVMDSGPELVPHHLIIQLGPCFTFTWNVGRNLAHLTHRQGFFKTHQLISLPPFETFEYAPLFGPGFKATKSPNSVLIPDLPKLTPATSSSDSIKSLIYHESPRATSSSDMLTSAKRMTPPVPSFYIFSDQALQH